MAVAATKAKAAPPRTVTRDEPAPRVAEARAPERDPNKIYTRDGREVDLGRIQNQDNDYSNLAGIGVFPPQGWTYEWRTISIKGAEYTEGIVNDQERGWTPVPSSRHDGKIMPRGHTGPIIKGGQMLMERDDRLTAMSRAAERRQANEPMINSRSRMSGAMLNAAPNSGAVLDHNAAAAQRGTFVRKVAEPENSGVITQRNYNYTLDE